MIVSANNRFEFHVFFFRPTKQMISRMLADECDQNFSYASVGPTNAELPSGYAVLHGRVNLGQGSATFPRAVEAIRQWKMFDMPDLWLCWPDAPIQPGSVVAVLSRHFGFWSLNFCRIVYTIDEDGPVRRYGFAYGTLPEHAESGEERFTVEWDRASDVVSYDILSFSRPSNWKVHIAGPVARRLQERFARDSLKAMARCCSG